ncbi:nuclease SbcCD subunit C [Tepiditoga spiralis]|uniref:Nuclease SbcCD subunit C n=1 Tax=Tepiditoga spiralis TaxID=2108365 RepID=A0A7G1G7T2_9BACT|nr:SbcC/MukB-like Walker B domain-containing protein [Tepiditoga spiralis]BBE31254.1 nuclease SbcCD subunit C [Tepiditoga spiralis]
MKPLLLEIEGLNSFQEKQVINFEELTKYGFFGIFGKTGSGKSTILDAIVLSLYGIIPRNTKEFINSSSQKTAVNYTFAIGENKYRIEREFKRNKNGILSHKCSVKNLNKQITIAENTSEAKKVIKDIIGLNDKDFLRCVVLPQGKFNELLTQTKGTERAEMLQRIFMLEKYGDKLYNELKNKKNDLLSNINELNGELNAYENINEEKLKFLENELLKINKEKESIQKELTSIAFEKYQKLWNNQNKLFEEEKKLIELLKNKDKIELYKKQIILAKKAINIKPNILEYEKLNEIFMKKNEYLNDLKNKIIEKENEFNKINKNYKLALREKESNYEYLIKYIEKLKDGLIFEENNKTNKTKKNKLEKELNKIIENKQILLDKSKNINNDINSNSKLLKTLIQKKENIKEIIKPEVKEILLKLLEINKEKNKIKIELNNTQTKKEELENDLYKNNNLIKELNKENESMNVEIKKLENEKASLSNEINYEKLQEFYEKLKKSENQLNDIEEKKLKLKNLKSALEKLENEKSNYYLLQKDIVNSLEENEKILNKINEINIKNLYAKIAKTLKENEPCPVCGSKHHDNPAKFEEIIDIDIKNEENIKNIIKELNFKKEDIVKKEAVLNTKINLIKNDIKPLNDLLNEFNLKKLNENYRKSNDLYENQKKINQKNNLKIENLKIKIKRKNEDFINLKEKISSTNQKLRNLKDLISEKNEHIKELNIELKKKSNEYNSRNKLIKIENPHKKFEEIKNSEKIYKKLEDEINKLNEIFTLKKEENENITKEIYNLDIRKTELTSKITSLKEDIEITTNKLNSITKNPSLKNELKNTKNKLKEFIEKEKNLKEELEKSFNFLNDLKNKYSSEKSTLNNLSSQIKNKDEFLKNLLKETPFKDKDDIKKYYLDTEEINKLEIIVENYKKDLTIINGTLENLKNELNGKSITEKEYQEIKTKKDTLNIHLEKIKKEEFLLKNKINENIEKIKIKNSLLKKLKIYIQKKDIYEELSKLFEGKKFVKFISSMQMNHITRDASQRLKKITNERYALEIDNESNFIIRDDGNGGTRRDPKSLSGGETFLASLSLALALSSQIQLKGKIPLEFFFLDEGFGTLDNELLDTVMNSLEKLRNEKLSVGIISHIDELKDRVPTKLLITSANPGNNGSKVKIEHS